MFLAYHFIFLGVSERKRERGITCRRAGQGERGSRLSQAREQQFYYRVLLSTTHFVFALYCFTLTLCWLKKISSCDEMIEVFLTLKWKIEGSRLTIHASDIMIHVFIALTEPREKLHSGHIESFLQFCAGITSEPFVMSDWLPQPSRKRRSMFNIYSWHQIYKVERGYYEYIDLSPDIITLILWTLQSIQLDDSTQH